MRTKKMSLLVAFQRWFFWLRFSFRTGFGEWFSKNFPWKIPTKKPVCDKFCEECGKPLSRIVAHNTGDGWAFFWDCENECSAGEEYIDDWYPFWFGVWCNSRDLAKIGIDEV